MVVLTDILLYFPLLVIVWLPIGIFLYTSYTNLYWKRNNVPYIPAKPIVGNLLDVALFKVPLGQLFVQIYNDKLSLNKPVVGINFFHKPILVLKNLELIKSVLVKDFSSFADRHSASDNHSDIVGGTNIFFLPNPAWKVIRNRLTPFFTSGKIKYTTDVIASCAFGVEANSLKNPDCEFRKNGRKIVDVNWYRSIELASMFLLPEIVPYFKFKVFSKDTSAFMRDSINYIMNERERLGTTRNDLIDALISLKNEDEAKHPSVTNIVFQGDVIIAQAAVFFAAGFETSSSAMSFGLYELACQPEIQTRLRQEIKEALQMSKGELTYDTMNGMVYMNMVVLETLRMFPPLPFLDRICLKNDGYSLEPYDNFIIPKGMGIMIPVFAIQRDPKYWPNPNKFDPERFSTRGQENIVPYSFMPFGVGPRSCIGERFGIMQMKVGLVNFLKNHYVRLSEKTVHPIILEPKALILQAKDGIILNVVRDPLL